MWMIYSNKVSWIASPVLRFVLSQNGMRAHTTHNITIFDGTNKYRVKRPTMTCIYGL